MPSLTRTSNRFLNELLPVVEVDTSAFVFGDRPEQHRTTGNSAVVGLRAKRPPSGRRGHIPGSRQADHLGPAAGFRTMSTGGEAFRV
jgi:hypothetical protein